MTRLCYICLAIALLSEMIGGGHAWAETTSEDPDSVVRSLLARAEAVFSARMEFFHTLQFTNSALPLIDGETMASFDGLNWVIRVPGGERSNYNGKFVVHMGEKSGTKSAIPDSVSVQRPQAIDAHDPPEAPYFAGSFWYKTTKEYVKDHANEAKVKGRAEVKGIPVIILEWVIPRDWKVAAMAFHGVNDLTEEGGVLRVCVAPQLGHALPLLEMVGKEGVVGSRFEAEDFIETAPGIFMPRRFSRHLYDKQGLVNFEKYSLKSVEKVNEPIPAEDFIIEAPRGSTLNDERPLNYSLSYRVGDDPATLPTDLSDVLVGMPPPPHPPLLTRSTAIWLGVGIGVALLTVYYFVRRRLGRQPG